MRLRTRLLLSYLPLLALLTLVLAACLTGWLHTGLCTTAALEQSLDVGKAISNVSDLSRDVALLELDYATEFPTPEHHFERARAQVDLKLKAFDLRLHELETRVDQPDLRAMVATVRGHFGEFRAWDTRLRERARSGQRFEARRLFYTEARPQHGRLEAATQELSDRYHEDRHRVVARLWQRQLILYGFGMVAVGALLLAAWALARSLTSRIAGPIVTLTQEVGRFRSTGLRLASSAPLKSGWQEVDLLHHEFLAMGSELGNLTLRLRQLNEQLEGQIEDRTASLELARRELEEKVEQLHALDRMRSNFVNVVSHELRTPLATIMGFAEFLEDELAGPLLPEQRQYLGHIQQAQLRLVRLVDDLLDFARLEAGTFRLSRGWADLDQILHAEVEAMVPQAQDNQVALHMERGERPVSVLIDRGRIGQVMTNLLNNAIKFTPAGGAVTVRMLSEPHAVRVEVQDTGIGVLPEHHGNLFERFFQVDSTPTRLAGGVGLGLSITKAIVEAHEGSIGLESVPGQGSTFWFSLPVSGLVH